MDGAAGQLGLLGVATGNEVQLDDVNADNIFAHQYEGFRPTSQKQWRRRFPA